MKILNNGLVLADLDNVLNAKIKRRLNGEYVLNLSAFEKNLKSQYFLTENVIELDGDFFDITYIKNTHKTDIIYDIECEHISYRLIKKAYVGGYIRTGTPLELLTNILQGTDLTVGNVDSGVSMTIAVDKDTNAYSLILNLANVLGWEIDYNGYNISLKDEIGLNNGFEVAFGKNLKSITKHVDKRSGELKVAYEIDLIELKESEEYIKKGYGVLEIINLGDTILINDEVLGLSISQKILSIEYDGLKRKNTKIEITNTIELITDNIMAIKNDIKENTASITVSNGQIILLTEDVQENTASITLANGEITSLASNIQNSNTLIQQNANQILLRATKANLVSEINQTAEAIKISASKLELNGLVTFNNLTDGSTQISGSNITTGTISANRVASDISQVNSTLNIGDPSSSTQKDIRFGSGALISSITSGNGPELTVSANAVNISGTSSITLSSASVNVSGSLTVANNTVATQAWVNARTSTAVFA